MKKYTDFKKEIQAKIDAFPFIFAFSNQQLEEGKQKLGITDNNQLLSIGSGGFIRKIDKQAYFDLMNSHDKALTDFLKDPEQLKDAFKYELSNHEYIITGDFRDTLESLGLDHKEMTDEQRAILIEARNEHVKEYWKREEEEDAKQEALATA